jgi:hypothetical protein
VKNANVFVDVDLTLVDANGALLPGAEMGLQTLRDAGCHLFLWSSNGANYAQSVATRYKLAELFEGFAAKPDIIIDDMPSTTVAPFVFNVHDEVSWPDMAQRIVKKHVD